MKLEDAPAAGWYPDPERGGELRWWEGTDWTDQRRPRATTTEIGYQDRERESDGPVKRRGEEYEPPRRDAGIDRRDADEIVAQVRTAAREEVQRAADLFSDRSRTAVRSLQRVVADYVTMVLRWVRIALVVGAILVIAWFVLQLFVQASLLNWLGDRIDSITD